jgi:hypothetical protein
MGFEEASAGEEEPEEMEDIAELKRKASDELENSPKQPKIASDE